MKGVYSVLVEVVLILSLMCLLDRRRRRCFSAFSLVSFVSHPSARKFLVSKLLSYFALQEAYQFKHVSGHSLISFLRAAGARQEHSRNSDAQSGDSKFLRSRCGWDRRKLRPRIADTAPASARKTTARAESEHDKTTGAPGTTTYAAGY